MKKILILSFILLASCSLNKVVHHHGVHNLETNQAKLKSNLAIERSWESILTTYSITYNQFVVFSNHLKNHI